MSRVGICMRTSSALTALFLVSCDDAVRPNVPFPGSMAIEIVTGDRQYALPGTWLREPLDVLVMHAVTGEPVPGVTVQWRVAAGPPGAHIEPSSAITDEQGHASARLLLGQEAGEHTIEATFLGLRREPARFIALGSTGLTVFALQPRRVRAGDTLVIEGAGFGARAADHIVMFDSVPAAAVSVAPTVLRVVVPPCLTSRSAQLHVRMGEIASNRVGIEVLEGADLLDLQLRPGMAQHFRAVEAARCMRLHGAAGARYLLIPFNASEQATGKVSFQLSALTHDPQVPTNRIVTRLQQSLAHTATWEGKLRQEQRARSARVRAQLRVLVPAARNSGNAPPAIGDRRGFGVFRWNLPAMQVMAEVKAVGVRAIIYQDIATPAAGFTSEDFAAMVRTFDEQIYPTNVAAFGTEPDVNGDDRVIILLSPAVNRLTPAGSKRK
jgi:hypothetical protein